MALTRFWPALFALVVLSIMIACGEPPPIGEPPLLTPFGILDPVTPPSDPQPTRLPTPAVLPSIGSFHQPGGFVHWGGPDDAVDTKGGDHCSIPSEMEPYDVPMYIRVKLAERTEWFLAHRIVQTGEDWRWTGYYRGSWQIWQGAHSDRLYIINSKAPETAFEYIEGGCE